MKQRQIYRVNKGYNQYISVLLVWLNGITLITTCNIMGSTPFFVIFVLFPHFARYLTLPFVSVLSQYDNFQYAVGNVSIGTTYVYSFEICIPFEYVTTPNM